VSLALLMLTLFCAVGDRWLSVRFINVGLCIGNQGTFLHKRLVFYLDVILISTEFRFQRSGRAG
jgi:hypothetical protein